MLYSIVVSKWMLTKGDMTVKWISVTDRLPRVMETVLLFVDAHTHPKHRFVSTGIRFPNDTFKWHRNAIIYPNAEVTHWMEIPKPPNGGKALEHECPKCGSDLDYFGGIALCPNDDCDFERRMTPIELEE